MSDSIHPDVLGSGVASGSQRAFSPASNPQHHLMFAPEPLQFGNAERGRFCCEGREIVWHGTQDCANRLSQSGARMQIEDLPYFRPDEYRVCLPGISDGCQAG